MMRTITTSLRQLPWPFLDRAGHFSWSKGTVLLGLMLPAAYVFYQLQSGAFDARPWAEVNRALGLWTIRLLILALAITPLRQSLGLPKLIIFRRMIGVAAFCYALAHFIFYALDKGLNWAVVAREIALRPYLTIGFVGLLILAALAVTSTDGAIRRLGGKLWQKLHRLVYAAGLLAVVHYFWQARLDLREPFLLSALFIYLMAHRYLVRRWDRGFAQSFLWLAILGLGLAVSTAIAEAIYFHFKTNADPLRVLMSNLEWRPIWRPSWAVAGITLSIAAGSFARQLWLRRLKLHIA